MSVDDQHIINPEEYRKLGAKYANLIKENHDLHNRNVELEVRLNDVLDDLLLAKKRNAELEKHTQYLSGRLVKADARVESLEALGEAEVLEAEKEQLKRQNEKLKEKLGRKQHVIETHVKFIQRLTDERDQYRRANIELEELTRQPACLTTREAELGDRLEDLVRERNVARAELRRAESERDAFQRIAQGYEMLWKGAIF